MVFTPRFARDRQTPKERAQEERRTRATHERRRKMRRKLLIDRARRRIAAGRAERKRKARNLKAGRGGGRAAGKAAAAKTAAKWGSRAIPVAGWALLLADLLVIGARAGRRIEGASSRLLDAQDANLSQAGLHLEAEANAQALGFVEGDRDLLRAIGQDGKMNSSIAALVAAVKKDAHERAIGANYIQSDPFFDSADTLLDRLLAKMTEDGTINKADRAVDLIRANGYGRMRSGR